MSTKIKCVLTEDSILGAKDTIVLVKRGYARNFLIPMNLAIPGSKENIKTAEENQKQRQRKIEKQREEALKIAEKFEKIVLEYKNEGDIDKISITSADVAELITKTTGQEINKKNIIINEKIDKEGEYNVQVNLFSDVNAYVKLIVKNSDKTKKKN